MRFRPQQLCISQYPKGKSISHLHFKTPPATMGPRPSWRLKRQRLRTGSMALSWTTGRALEAMVDVLNTLCLSQFKIKPWRTK